MKIIVRQQHHNLATSISHANRPRRPTNTMGGIENEHAPPSSAEEAAALLGAAISVDAPLRLSSSATAAGHANPPKGMHSIFTVQTPVPNQVLFVRLCNLRAWLRWHASALEDAPDAVGLDDGVSCRTHLRSAPTHYFSIDVNINLTLFMLIHFTCLFLNPIMWLNTSSIIFTRHNNSRKILT